MRILLVLWAMSASMMFAAPLELAGLPVVISKTATPAERFAAQELARYLETITGAPSAVSDSAERGIFVGRKFAEEAGVRFTPELVRR